ncbi:hypothetical protein, partial [Paenibacillus xylaniclasticus]|uniref:hypothetical protein n=1 Tax=Paenibacillus xylaniclasticus TaxID=588083 RepID=UPI0013DF61CD
GAGAVAMAALGGAVIGAAASVASTYISDQINGTQTSAKGYLMNAGIGAIAGAFSGAVFGPLFSSAAATLLPMTARQMATNTATVMFAAGTEEYVSESLSQMWNGRVDPAAAWRAFGFGALTGGAFEMGKWGLQAWAKTRKEFIPYVVEKAKQGGSMAKRMVTSAKNAASKYAREAKEALAEGSRRTGYYLDPKNYIKVVDTGFSRIPVFTKPEPYKSSSGGGGNKGDGKRAP